MLNSSCLDTSSLSALKRSAQQATQRTAAGYTKRRADTKITKLRWSFSRKFLRICVMVYDGDYSEEKQQDSSVWVTTASWCEFNKRGKWIFYFVRDNSFVSGENHFCGILLRACSVAFVRTFWTSLPFGAGTIQRIFSGNELHFRADWFWPRNGNTRQMYQVASFCPFRFRNFEALQLLSKKIPQITKIKSEFKCNEINRWCCCVTASASEKGHFQEVCCHLLAESSIQQLCEPSVRDTSEKKMFMQKKNERSQLMQQFGQFVQIIVFAQKGNVYVPEDHLLSLNEHCC